MSDSHITVTSFFSDSSWNKMCLWNTMYTHHIYMTFVLDLWPWRMTLTFHHSKCAAPWDAHACQISSCYLQYCKSIHKMSDFGHIYLTSDLEGWPWPFTTQNVQLHEIHMHAKYQVAIFNIKKVMANVKVFWQTDASYLKFDLDGWLWPSPVTTQNVQLHEIHMHAKYQVAIINIAKVMTKV